MNLSKIKNLAGETSNSMKNLADFNTVKALNSSRNSKLAQAKKISIKNRQTMEKKDEELSSASIASEKSS